MHVGDLPLGWFPISSIIVGGARRINSLSRVVSPVNSAFETPLTFEQHSLQRSNAAPLPPKLIPQLRGIVFDARRLHADTRFTLHSACQRRWPTLVDWLARGRMALGGCPPRPPTDPHVDALDHTVSQITPSLCRSSHRGEPVTSQGWLPDAGQALLGGLLPAGLLQKVSNSLHVGYPPPLPSFLAQSHHVIRIFQVVLEHRHVFGTTSADHNLLNRRILQAYLVAIARGGVPLIHRQAFVRATGRPMADQSAKPPAAVDRVLLELKSGPS